jgi:enamine deaminase RidA (YjgF/YER057c/UK114 family)
MAAMIERFQTDAPWESQVGYSRAVKAGDWVLLAGTTAVRADGSVASPDDAYGQAICALQKIREALGRMGAQLKQVVRTRVYVVDISQDADGIGKAHAEFFGSIQPVTTMVEVQRLLRTDMRVEIEVEAYVGE